MYEMLKHSHSGIRWIVLILIIAAIGNALMKWQSGRNYGENDRKLGFFAMLSAHIQLLIGLGLYFMSPKVQFTAEMMKNSLTRFFTMEHALMMLIALVLITIGYSKAKRAVDSTKKFKLTFWFFLAGLILILVSIPWPFQDLGASWF